MALFLIREQHMSALEAVAQGEFVTQVCLYLRKNHHPTVGELPEDPFRRMVTAGIARARSFGLTMDTAITAFVAIMFEVAPNFDEHTRIRGLLTRSDVAPDDGIFQLSEHLTPRDWEEARLLYDPAAWRHDSGAGDADR